MAGLIESVLPIASMALDELAKYEPDIASAIKALPSQLSGAATAATTSTPSNSGVGPQTAMVKNIAKHMPAVTTAEWNTLTAQIGIAVAEAATAYLAANPGAAAGSANAYLMSATGEAAVAALVNQAFAGQGLTIPASVTHTLNTMIAIGIEMYIAGLGTNAVTVTQAS